MTGKKVLRRMIVVIKAVSLRILVGAFWMEQNGMRLYLRTEKDVVVAEPISVRFCDTPPLHTHNELRETVAGGGAQIIACRATPRAISPSKSYLHKPGGAQWQAGTQIKDPNQGPHLVWAPPRAVPAEPSAPVSRRETHLDESSRAALQITFWTKGLLPRGGTCCGMQGKSSRTGLMGSLGQEPKAGQGSGLGDFGRNKSGKIEGQGDKKGWSHVNSLLVSTLD